MLYKKKYLKYKKKYLKLQLGGSLNDEYNNILENIINSIFNFNNKKLFDKYITSNKCISDKVITNTIENKICLLNERNITYIYHFGDLEENQNQNIDTSIFQYRYIDYKNITEDQFKCIFSFCKNIFIYIDIDHNNIESDDIIILDSKYNFIKNINKWLEDIICSIQNIKRFLNVTIVNKIINIKYILFSFLYHENNDIFKKIINVIPAGIDITFLDKNIYDIFNTLIYNKKITITNKKTQIYINNIEINNNYKRKYPIKQLEEQFKQEQQGGSNLDCSSIKINKNIYIYINTFIVNESESIYDKWWYKFYYNISPCSYGRLMQSEGTCWCNALINSLILTSFIANKFIIKFNEYSKKDEIIKRYTSFSDLYNSEEDLEHLLYAMIYILLILKNKAHQEDNNFIGLLAARIKGIYHEKSITNPDGKEDYYKTGYIDYMNNRFKTKINFFKSDHKEYRYGDSGDSLQGLYVIFKKLFNKNDYFIIEKCDKIKSIFLENNSNKIFNKNDIINEKIDLPDIIVIVPDNDNTSNVQTNLYIIDDDDNNKKYHYKLESSVLYLTDTPHAIAGLSCNNKFYVYDSNNYLVFTNWYEYTKTNKNNEYREYLNTYLSTTNNEYHEYLNTYLSTTNNIELSKDEPPYSFAYVIYKKRD